MIQCSITVSIYCRINTYVSQIPTCHAYIQLITNMSTVYIMLNKNTWGVKKVRGQEEPATKSSDIT